VIGESGDPDIAARPARWLTIHAHDGGFAAFMRGARDGVEVELLRLHHHGRHANTFFVIEGGWLRRCAHVPDLTTKARFAGI